MRYLRYALLIACICIAGAVQAKTFDVSSASEFRDALSEAGRGDVIQLAPGDYRMQVEPKRAGVTIRGAPEYKSRLLLPGNTSGGRQIVTIRQDDITLESLVIDGEKKPNSGHGLVRVGSSRGVRITNNRIINSGSSNLNIGGSIKKSYIYDIEVRGNYICGSGFTDQYGEAIYVSDFSGSGRTDDIRIVGNEICNGTDNLIDLKPPTRNAQIHHNHFHNQAKRQGQDNAGTLVVQGQGVKFYDNYIQDVVPGKAVFNLLTKGDITVENNVVETVRGAQTLVRSRGSGKGGKTEVDRNIFCDTGGAKMQNVSGMVITNYAVVGDNAPCREAAKPILAAVETYQTGGSKPPPDPDPLPELRVVKITYGETTPFNVRVYTETVEPGADSQMDEREYHEGSVHFYKLDSTALTFYRQKPAPDRYPDGWNFHLSEPYPDEAIRMVAEKGWIDGGPPIDQLIPRWTAEPEPLPTLELEPGQRASCDQPIMILGQIDSKYLMGCGERPTP